MALYKYSSFPFLSFQCFVFSSLLWYCWLGDWEDIWPLQTCSTYPQNLTGSLPFPEQLHEPVNSPSDFHQNATLCGASAYNTAAYTCTARRYASAIYTVVMCLSVGLSVCPSVTSQCCTKMTKPRITHTTPHNTPGDSSFMKPKILLKFDRLGSSPTAATKTGWIGMG